MTKGRPAFDCVVTYHQNPLTCGVTKFNHILAERLGVPVVHLFDAALSRYARPLLSIKCSEFTDRDMSRLQDLVEGFPDGLDFSLFFHDFSDTLTEFELVRKASAVYCGNEKIYATLKPHAPRIEELWSPATIRPSGADVGVGEITIFSFGMAHKLRAHHYFRLRQLLEQSGRSYTIFLSTALHEGTSFEDAFTVSFEQLERVFGQHVRFLGFLSDDAVIEYLRRSTFFTAFFEQGVRANNSSVIAAMENGCVVVTNLDEHSPDFCRHGETVFDIGRLDALPTDAKLLSAVSESATAAVRNRSWDALLERLV